MFNLTKFQSLEIVFVCLFVVLTSVFVHISPSVDPTMTNNLTSARGLSLKDLLEKQDFPGANVTASKKRGEQPNVAGKFI